LSGTALSKRIGLLQEGQIGDLMGGGSPEGTLGIARTPPHPRYHRINPVTVRQLTHQGSAAACIYRCAGPDHLARDDPTLIDQSDEKNGRRLRIVAARGDEPK